MSICIYCRFIIVSSNAVCGFSVEFSWRRFLFYLSLCAISLYTYNSLFLKLLYQVSDVLLGNFCPSSIVYWASLNCGFVTDNNNIKLEIQMINITDKEKIESIFVIQMYWNWIVFYAQESNDWEHIVFVCLFVCLFVCCQLLHPNFWTIRDKVFIFCMHTPTTMPCKWHQGQWLSDHYFYCYAKNSFFGFVAARGIAFHKYILFHLQSIVILSAYYFCQCVSVTPYYHKIWKAAWTPSNFYWNIIL